MHLIWLILKLEFQKDIFQNGYTDWDVQSNVNIIG